MENVISKLVYDADELSPELGMVFREVKSCKRCYKTCFSIHWIQTNSIVDCYSLEDIRYFINLFDELHERIKNAKKETQRW